MMSNVQILTGYTKVQAATAHLNGPATREMLTECTASGRKLLQTSDAQNLRMHAEYQLDDVDPAFVQILQVSTLTQQLCVPIEPAGLQHPGTSRTTGCIHQ